MKKWILGFLLSIGSMSCGTSAVISLPTADGITISATGRIIYDKTTHDKTNGLTYIYNPRLKLNTSYGSQKELPFNEGNITYSNLCYLLGYKSWELQGEKTMILEENVDSIYIEGQGLMGMSQIGPWSLGLANRSWTGASGKREGISIIACRK